MIGCASQVLDSDAAKVIAMNDEYEKQLEIKDLEASTKSKDSEAKGESTSVAQPTSKESNVKSVSTSDKNKKSSSQKAESAAKASSRKKEPKPAAKKTVATKKPEKSESKSDKKVKVETQVRLPKIEDAAGFNGRRPLEDPFGVGEKVTLTVSYFGVTAGELTLEVPKMAEVNGNRAYQYLITVKSKGLFSRFYSVDDVAETYVDYENLLPYNLTMHVRESKQLKEIRNLFNWDKMQASYWEKKVTDDKGVEKKKVDWALEPFSQNVISAVFYMRNFQMTPGKTLQFRVADRGKNILFKGHVLRKERIKTAEGELNTIVLKPEFEVDGIFKPVGDILFWLTDDSRKQVVRIESEIKIGTLVCKLKSLKR